MDMSSAHGGEVVVFDATLIAQREHWMARLGGAPWTSGLEHWLGSPEGPALRVDAVLDAELCASIEVVTRRSEFLTLVIAHAAWAIVAWRLSGRTSIAIGTPALKSARPNLVPALTTIPSVATAKSFLTAVRAVLLDAYDNQSYPYRYLLRSLELAATSPTPFDVVLELDGFHASPPPFEARLHLRLTRAERGLTGSFAHAPGACSAEHASLLATLWQQAIRALVTQPETRLADLPLSDAGEIRRILAWSGAAAGPAGFTPVHRVLADSATRWPGAVAVESTDGCLTHGELDAQARGVARLLRSRGAAPERLVAILLPRSKALVVALIAVMKTGAAFLPLDPSDPPNRLSLLLQDSSISLVVTNALLADHLAGVAAPILVWERDCADATRDAPILPDPCVSSESLAYVVHTSGSTGRPKGVMATQEGLANYLSWCASAYGRGVPYASILHTSVSFDLTLTSLLAPLVNGGSIVLAPDTPDGMFAPLARRSAFGVLKLTPGHLTLINDALAAATLDALEGDFVIGGEVLPAAGVVALRERCPAVRVFNEYGPAETVVGCCVERASPEFDAPRRTVPIGRPIPGTRLYVLDDRMNLASAGVPGELYIGGPGVARGYLAQPALTAERFVPDPFSAVSGARLYRTGDRVRYLADGRLDCMGRLDQQVKIRGYRVELGEVEQAVREHAAVREAVVLVRESSTGDRRLVAFCTRRDQADLQDWRTFLATRISDHMIPAALHVIDELPLSANGKLNREALLTIDEAARHSARFRLAPRNGIEETVAGIWCELLEHREIGVDDDFFDLGGHSLFAIQMLSRVKKALDVELPLRALFDAPTVAGLASLIAAHRAATDSTADAQASIPRVPRGIRIGAGGELSAAQVEDLLAAVLPVRKAGA
jgi:amino acid adenylation domain-containing protein